jgi:hydrogenase maturation protease
LLEPYETVIFVDACPRGDVPGTLYVIEPDVASIAIADPNHPAFDAHAIDPVNVVRLAKSLGPLPSGMRILLLGCEPLTFGPEEGQLGLSDQVSSAVGRAVTMLQEMVLRILAGRYPGSAN